MSQQKLLIKVVDILENCEIEYMITGSVVSSFQGEPRSTHDIDIVIAIQYSDIDKFKSSFPSDFYYLSESSIQDAIQQKSMFNLIDIFEGDKVDFWVLTKEPFDLSRFKRRITNKFLGHQILFSSPEDTILAKLKWCKLSGGSEKQFTDALRVYEVQYEILNIEYLELWIESLNLKELWQKLTNEANTINN